MLIEELDLSTPKIMISKIIAYINKIIHNIKIACIKLTVDMNSLIFLTLSFYINIIILVFMFYIGCFWRGCNRWKGLINQKEDREVKYMDLEREWEQDPVEILLKTGEEKAGRDCQLKAAGMVAFFYKEHSDG